MIASLPRSRQDKVLAIRRQLAEGTYTVAHRLDETIDRILETLTAARSPLHSGNGHDDRRSNPAESAQGPSGALQMKEVVSHDRQHPS